LFVDNYTPDATNAPTITGAISVYDKRGLSDPNRLNVNSTELIIDDGMSYTDFNS
jgi:hypothetical protein